MKKAPLEQQCASRSNRQQNRHRQVPISRYYVSKFLQVKVRWMRGAKQWVTDAASTDLPDKTNLDAKKFATGKFFSRKVEPIFSALIFGAPKFELRS